jgi:hypothetical protein
MFVPTAKIIADSINPNGDRLTTVVAKYHRFIHQEVLTHRVFSRNASSSRAIPVKKQIQKAMDDNVYPLHWGRNQPGMIADVENNELIRHPITGALVTKEQGWDDIRLYLAAWSNAYADANYHKQIVNRLLESFSTITVIITATEWDNFFDQRCHPSAQPEIRAIAVAIRDAYNLSVPVPLKWGEWHLPFIESIDHESGLLNEELIEISAARSARVSYLNHEGERDINKDLELYEKLRTATPPHLSPLEHPAKALAGQWANLTGFQSHRWEHEQK